MKHYTHVIWDFNGTILDDVDACILCANRLLTAHGLKKIASKEEYRSLFGFPIIDYYRRMGFDFEKISYADLAVEWVAYYLESSASSTVYKDIPATLEAIRKKGLCQMILSATELNMLEGQVTSLGIRPYFDRLLGLENIQAHSKEEVGLRWREENPDACVLMVGDTDHDAQVAQAIGADCVLLTTGHQNRETLEKLPALFVADSAKAVLELIS